MAESEEEDVLVQRVVKDINNAFKRNPNIDEIGLILCPEARYNRSPIVLVENKLGVESWCVKFLLPYVHNKLLLYRQRKQWLDREALVDITCTLLLLNSDFTTAWNVRKELLQCGALNPERDLYLGKLALTKFPKSPETWIHRRWVLQQVLRECSPPSSDRNEQGDSDLRDSAERTRLSERLHRVLHDEMKVCADAASRYPSNYNAWSHRIWVLQNMAQGNLKVLHDELSSMREWVSMHVSDHSGFHYRQFLLKALVRELSQSMHHHHAPWPSLGSSSPRSPSPDPQPGHPPHQANGEATAAAPCPSPATPEDQSSVAAVPQLFHQEMELCTDLIQSFPGHETLWCHRRHIFYLWHHWRRDHDHHEGQGRGSESPQLNHTDDGLSRHPHTASPRGVGLDRVESRNGQAQEGQNAMEVDGVGVPDPRDTKRLKRGPPDPCPPALPSEHGFVASVLDGCRSPEQGCFALAYRKWLDSVIGQ
ncbi:protein prenyltransferase alpha subunit repeat-containing protein 1-like isoform X1 [Salvelinus fontinalis]|uniref:protein prenyltransferase alpha subunit repeat-containing protein 1-like isoform X1 n=1 Tax=Salvelinus fontinalis TaxID=8038 RepID=UPI0024855269|nr:protein prenyltransferase alpha subunit repeat-containing protein 1-like isoform X1 [Salvelinus fontinalis]